MIKTAVITVSDRSYMGEKKDETGVNLKKFLINKNFDIVYYSVVPDSIDKIKEKLVYLSDVLKIDFIITNGGTGFSKRDVTPDATLEVLDKIIPGFSEIMRLKSYEISKYAILSREISGIRNNSIIINLPGSPKAAIENLSFIIDVIPHGVKVLKGEVEDCCKDLEE